MQVIEMKIDQDSHSQIKQRGMTNRGIAIVKLATASLFVALGLPILF
jgi:hypothetical protein